jgi:hypothetical protein
MKKTVLIIFISLFFAVAAQSQIINSYDNYFLKSQYDFLYSRKSDIRSFNSPGRFGSLNTIPIKEFKSRAGNMSLRTGYHYNNYNASNRDFNFFIDFFIPAIGGPIIIDILRNLN